MSGLLGIRTPHRGNGDSVNDSDAGITFGEVDSFVEPPPKLGDRNRAPLKALSDNPRKAAEFTPMLKSAHKKDRLLQYETPGQKVEQSIHWSDNSGLTPVHLTSKLRVNGDSSAFVDNNASSPASSDIAKGPGGIREQEKAMDKMKNENWELKLKVYMLENQMFKSTPEHVQLALKENIEYKIQVQSLRTALARTKHDFAETQKKVASLGDLSASLSVGSCQLPHATETADALKRMTQERDELLAEKEDLEMQCRTTEEALDDMQDHRDGLQQEFEASQDKLDEVQRQLHTSETATAELEVEIAELKDRLTLTSQPDADELKTLYADQARQQSQLEEYKVGSSRLQDQLKMAENQVSSLTERIRHLEARNDSLEAGLDEQSQFGDKSQRSGEKDRMQLEIASLTSDNDRQRREMQVLEKQVDALQQEINEREEDIAELQGAAEDYSMELRQAEEKLQAHNDRVAELASSRQIEDLEEQVRNAKLMSRESDRLKSDLQAQIGALERKCQEQESRDQLRTRTIQEHESAIAKQSNHVQSLEKELALSKQKSATLSQRHIELEQQIRELESTDDPDTTQVQDRLRNENEELRETIEDLEYQIRSREEEIDELRSKAQHSQGESKAALEASLQTSLKLQSTEQQLESCRTQVTELRRLLQTTQDKIIVNEEVRAKLQEELVSLRQDKSQQMQQVEALTTSLLSVRTRLSDAQASHKAEVQVLVQARDAGSAQAAQQQADLESRISAQIAQHNRLVEEADKTREGLLRRLEESQQQIKSLEATIKQFSDSEETVSLDQRRYRDALQAETQRHAQQAEAAKLNIEELQTTIVQLRQLTTDQQQDLQDHATRVRQVESENNQKTKELQSLLDQVEQLKQETLLGRADSEAASKEKDKLTAELSRAEGRILSLLESISSARHEHQDELLKRSDELFAESQKSQDLLDRLKAAEARVVSSEQEKQRLVLSLASADQRLIASEEQISTLKRTQEELIPKNTSRPNSAVLRSQVDLESELSSVKATLQSLELELDEIAAERNLLQDQLDELSTADAQYRAETSATLRGLRNDLATSQSALSKERELCNQNEASAELKLREAQSKSMKEISSLRATINDLQDSLAHTKKSHAALLRNVGRADTSLSPMAASAHSLLTEVDRLKADNARLKEFDGQQEAMLLIDELELQISELEADLAKSREDILLKNDEIRSEVLKERKRQLANIDLLRTDLQQRNAELLSAKHDCAALTAAKQELEAQLEKHSLRGSHTLQTSAIATNSERDANELRKQLQDVKNDLRSKKETIAGLQSDLAYQRRAERQLQEDLARVSRDARLQEGELATKERKLNEYRSDAKIKADRIQALEHRLDSLTHQAKVTTRHVGTTGSTSQMIQKHKDEIAGLTKMLRYLRSKTTREESFRADLAYIKSYYDKQISSFEACNQANLTIIKQIGIYPNEVHRKQRATLKRVANVVLATIRMQKSARAWSVMKAEKDKIDDAIRARKISQR